MSTTWRPATVATLSALLVAGLSACGVSPGGGASGGDPSVPEKKAADLDPKGALEAAATAMTQVGSAGDSGSRAENQTTDSAYGGERAKGRQT
ncbi:hypothetical protein K2224_18010 [Streptomyces sp. BHT-5-2]|uniref:hypothetical protein n=1 Tax=Streptomyces sp. BHT-5-2 TaxID=2866715 RepID=UPI001C8EFC15|nr:hypothetical protein [Streptomyces sp. BHT-5-2]QZL04805.1 hypothetical protein K2224_18010 [Streptomyces sp. BHT-5-2]